MRLGLSLAIGSKNVGGGGGAVSCIGAVGDNIISGSLRDSLGITPIAGADIYICDGTNCYHTLSIVSGDFSIADIANGLYTVRAGKVAIGFKEVGPFDLNGGAIENTGNISLTEPYQDPHC